MPALTFASATSGSETFIGLCPRRTRPSPAAQPGFGIEGPVGAPRGLSRGHRLRQKTSHPVSERSLEAAEVVVAEADGQPVPKTPNRAHGQRRAHVLNYPRYRGAPVVPGTAPELEEGWVLHCLARPADVAGHGYLHRHLSRGPPTGLSRLPPFGPVNLLVKVR